MPRKRLKRTGERAKKNTVNKAVSGGDINDDAAQLSRWAEQIIS